MTGIIPFDFETNAVRTVMIEGKPWWVATDVCRVLEIKNTSQALQRLDEDQKGVSQIYTLGGEQVMNVVNQSGLFMLIARSDKPVAKRFMRWVFDVVIPALIRDGYYEMPGVARRADQAELAAKRAYYAALPDSHRDKAARDAEMVRQVEDLIAQGWKVGEATRAVAAEHGCGERSIYYRRRAVYMVAQADHPAALAPRWAGPRGMMVECHPEAMQFWIGLVGSGARISDCYRRLCDAAAENGWGPIPSERTMRRVGERLLPRDISRPLSRKKEKAA